MKILNLYACLGGNRLNWKGCEVTAVELDKELARMYSERFPEDEVVIADAHEYLLNNYERFDFIWSSPPCPSHSRARFWNTKANRIFPDFNLYEEIVFLKHHFEGKFVVENVIPYYEPMLNPKKIGRHLFWSNFLIPNIELNSESIEKCTVEDWVKYHKIEKFDYKGSQRKDKILRNLVHFETGEKILNLAKGIIEQNNIEQVTIFDVGA